MNSIFKIVGSPLTSANRLRDRSPNLTWKELKSKLSMHYFHFLLPVMPSRLLDIYHKIWMKYLKCIHTLQVSCHVSNFSRGLSHYTIVHGLHCRKLKDSVGGYWSAHWKSMEDCFRDICTFGAGYDRDKGYCKADFNVTKPSTINEVKSTKDPELCFTCSVPHFQTDAQNTEI